MVFIALTLAQYLSWAANSISTTYHTVASSQTYNVILTENLTMNNNMPKSSRPAPPQVLPIVHKGVRYEQDMESYNYGGNQPGGYLVAVDPATNERLWMLKVYEVTVHDAAGVSTPGRYFRIMHLVPERNEIEIENEVGGKYVVDLSKRIATWVSGPDSVHK